MTRLVVLFALVLAGCATPASKPVSVSEPDKVRVPEAMPPAPAETTPPVTPVPVPPDVAVPRPPTLPTPTPAPAPLFRDFVARNDENLLNVYIGMSKPEMLRIMGAHDTRWHNPYKHEVLLDRVGKSYEVFYYLTQDPEGKPVHDRHLMPVIVKDSAVVAIGAYRLKKLRRGESLALPRRRASE